MSDRYRGPLVGEVLIVEDDPVTARLVERHLSSAGHDVTVCASAEEAQLLLRTERFGVALVDVQLPGMSGLDLIERERGRDGRPPFLVLTADRDVASAVRAMKAGAVDFMSKPVTPQLLDVVMAKVVEHARMKSRLARYEQQAQGPDETGQSRSPVMQQALELARRAAASDAAAVLLVGESGVGKEVMATYIHQQSPRAKGPFVRINVAAIPDTMIEAELFGTTRGAYTDAKKDREGFFMAAHRGTLLLDEIGELKPELQAKLLRAIETKRFYPVGASREVSSDVRIVAATNRSPERAVNEGRLRADLYYRLATVVVRIPALRERAEDIEGLTDTILRSLRGPSRGPMRVAEEALEALRSYPWPGNVRELRNVLERATILSDGPVLSLDELRKTGFLPSTPPTSKPGGAKADDVVGEAGHRTLAEVAQAAYDEAERAHIKATLERTRNNRTRAAQLLGVSRSTLWQKLKKHGLSAESDEDC